MPKFKVTATMDVGYTAIIEADTKDEAWAIARNGDEADWEQTDNGHDWTVENIREVEDDDLQEIPPHEKFEVTVDAKGNWAVCKENGGDVIADLMTEEDAIKICNFLNWHERRTT